jgi:hypothetical protein
MDVEQNDWLDRKLAMKEQYIPDDGFTAHVIGRLPKKRTSAIAQVRRVVLGVTGVIAFALFVVLLVPTIPLVRELPTALARYVSPTFWNHVSALLMQPAVMFGISAVIVALCFACLPLLRRVA